MIIFKYLVKPLLLCCSCYNAGSDHKTANRQEDRQKGRSQTGGNAMLVLSRKKGEKIIIDEKITIEVVEIKNKQIRLGFQAAPNIPIRRAEVPARDGQTPPPRNDQ
jgi:carbon storage regulator CsrA